MYLVRALFFVAAHANFYVMIIHIPGVSKVIADALFRMQMDRFRQNAPDACPLPDPIPAKLTLDPRYNS